MNIEIPEKFHGCIKEIAEVCRKHGVGGIAGTLHSSLSDIYHEDKFDFEWYRPVSAFDNDDVVVTAIAKQKIKKEG